jgi:RimJ/RimL family protein N-acetyltransferase
MLNIDSEVRLEPIAPRHAASMFRWMLDSEVASNVGLRQQPSMQKTQAWVEKAMADSSVCAFAIMCGNAHVGNVVLDLIDTHVATARLSVYVGEANFRGKGVGRTAVYLALDHAFSKKHLHKVWLTTHAANVRAISTYTRLGFVLEGVLREEFLLNGSRVHLIRFSLLSSEFAALQTKEGVR